MAKPNEPYQLVEVESYRAASTSGLHGKVHIRPCKGQGYPELMHVECSKKLSKDYPVGTRFRVRAKLTDREGGSKFLYSYFGWKYEVIEESGEWVSMMPALGSMVPLNAEILMKLARLRRRSRSFIPRSGSLLSNGIFGERLASVAQALSGRQTKHFSGKQDIGMHLNV